MASTDTRVIGDIAEQKFTLLCITNGIEINKPSNSGLQHDFVIFYKGKYQRVQIKSRKMEDGRISGISKYKVNTGRKKLIEYNKSNIDLYIVYCPETEKFYSIPLEELAKAKYSVVLRVGNSKNKQTKHIRFADKYEFIP